MFMRMRVCWGGGGGGAGHSPMLPKDENIIYTLHILCTVMINEETPFLVVSIVSHSTNDKE